MVTRRCLNAIGSVMHYETLKIVDIKNKKVGFSYRAIQLIILVYVVGYVIIYKKGYQEQDIAISTVNTKLKGTGYVNFKNFSPLFDGIQVYDPTDYVIPSRERNGFFVMTNMVITPNQTQGRCPGDEEIRSNRCSSNKDCQPAYTVLHHGNGVRTGSCVYSKRNPTIKICEIYGWCPTEDDKLPMTGQNFSKTIPLLHYAKDFTVLVRNHIYFPKFQVQRRNIIGFKNRNALKHCTYHKDDNKYCPIFKLGDILEYCGDNFTRVAYRGGIYGIHIKWDCDLNFSLDICLPTYHFTRLDDPDAPISPGYNFRFNSYYVSGNRRYRTLTKAFGIKFLVLVDAKAGKFSPIPLFINLGAGLALLGLATVGCDFMMIHCLKRRKKYRRYKVDSYDDSEESVNEEDESIVRDEKHSAA